MGGVQLPEALQHVIELEVAAGRAVSSAAFLEEAVMRLIDDAAEEEHAIRQAAEAGSADMEAGRYTTIASPEDERLLHERIMKRLRDRSAAER